MFKESLRMHGDNRRFAETLAAEPALIADGTTGVVIHHGKRLIVLTHDEATTLMQQVSEALSA